MTTTTPRDKQYVLFFDGGSSGNPGPAGCGSVLYEDGVEIWSDSFYVGDWETNNTAEYMGLIRGLQEAVHRNIQHLLVKGDSLMVIQQMRGNYQVHAPHLQRLFYQACDVGAQIHQVFFEHVPRKMNMRADQLSRVRTRPPPSLATSDKTDDAKK